MKRLDLLAVYKSEAVRIAAAREIAAIIHASGDIRASGNEVERTVREVIADRLPSRCRTTHGHIIDYQSGTSPQLDVIISEDIAAKSLFETADGTEYVPYEAVYAVGEIKAAYYKSQQPIQKFSENIRKIRESMRRQTGTNHRVLKFMFFASANDFAVADVKDFYRSTPKEDLPNFVCLMDLGVITFTQFLPNGHGDPVATGYRLSSSSIATPDDEKYKWALLKWGNEADRAGTILMFLHLSLVQHMQHCGMAAPNLYPYMSWALGVMGGEIFE